MPNLDVSGPKPYLNTNMNCKLKLCPIKIYGWTQIKPFYKIIIDG